MNMKLHPMTLKFSGESSHLEEPFLKIITKVSLSKSVYFLILGALTLRRFRYSGCGAHAGTKV